MAEKSLCRQTSPLRSACLWERTGHRRTFLAAALGARRLCRLARPGQLSSRWCRSEAGTEYTTLGRFREDQPRLEATAAAHGRGNQGQATADLLHHTVDDGEPETSARANR
jgi:hypothetical protein